MNVIEGTDDATRLDTAKHRALRTVETLRFMDEMTVMSVHKRPIIHSPFTNHQKSLRAAINAIQPTDVGTDLEPAIDLANAIVQTKSNPEIVIFSDFQSISEALLERLNRRMGQGKDTEASDREIKHRLIRIGKTSDNVGITQFRVRKSLVNPFDYETLLRVVNASEEGKQFNVELYFEENLFDVRPYTLAPGESKSEIFSNFTFEGGKLKAILDVDDALSTDNTAYATLPKREHISVLLVTEENPFLEKALTVDEQIKLTVLTPAKYEVDGLAKSANPQGKPKDYQVVIFDRYSPSTLGAGNYMFIYPPAPPSSLETSNTALKWGIGAPLETPIITEWDRTHPILRHVHLENVQIGEAYRMTPPATAQVLARSFEAPVLFVDTTRDRKIVFAAIDILQSDLPLRIAFPVIIANTIQWFQQDSGIQEYYLRTGEVLRQRIEPLTATDLSQNVPGNVTITGPGDETWEMPIEQNEILFDQTRRAGFYELKLSPPETTAPTGEKDSVSAAVLSAEDNTGTVWAFNLADETEVHIRTDPSIEGLLEESMLPNSVALWHYPPWVYFVFIAVVLSSVEWFLYQRRRID